MANKFDLSIVIPVYNSENYIQRCLESIVSQTFKNLEIIIVNDGSTDKSLEIINEFAQSDNRIRVINKTNGGVSSARNRGIREANGRYIGFIDSDDYVEREMYEKMYSLANERDVDMVICGRRMEYPGGRQVFLLPNLPEDKIFEDDLKKEYIYKEFINMDDKFSSVFTKIYRTEVLISNDIYFDEQININEDWLFNIKAFTYAKRIAVINKPYHNYMVENMSSLSRKYRSDFDTVFKRKYEKLIEYMSEWEIYNDSMLIKLNTSYCYYLAFSAINIFDMRNSIKLKEKFKKVRDIMELKPLDASVDYKNWRLSHKFKIWCVRHNQATLLYVWGKLYFMYLNLRK